MLPTVLWLLLLALMRVVVMTTPALLARSFASSASPSTSSSASHTVLSAFVLRPRGAAELRAAQAPLLGRDGVQAAVGGASGLPLNLHRRVALADGRLAHVTRRHAARLVAVAA